MRYDGRGGGGRGGFRRFGGRSRFGGGSRFNDLPKPIKVGEEYDAEITEEGSKGDGIARIKNFVVFVAGAKKGEKVKIKITDVRNRFAIAEKVGAASEAAEATETTEAPTEVAETAEEVKPAEAAEDVGEKEAEATEPEPEVESEAETAETPEAEATEEG